MPGGKRPGAAVVAIRPDHVLQDRSFSRSDFGARRLSDSAGFEAESGPHQILIQDYFDRGSKITATAAASARVPALTSHEMSAINAL